MVKILIGSLMLIYSTVIVAEEVQLIDQTGIYIIPILINDSITIDSIFDTGASEMVIPFNIIAALIQAKSITSTDYLKDGTHILADGSIHTNERVNIKKIVIGKTSFYNLTAIVGSKNSMTLIGQNLLRKVSR
jgi:predicted aspartyl protease